MREDIVIVSSTHQTNTSVSRAKYEPETALEQIQESVATASTVSCSHIMPTRRRVQRFPEISAVTSVHRAGRYPIPTRCKRLPPLRTDQSWPFWWRETVRFATDIPGVQSMHLVGRNVYGWRRDARPTDFNPAIHRRKNCAWRMNQGAPEAVRVAQRSSTGPVEAIALLHRISSYLRRPCTTLNTRTCKRRTL